MNSSQTAQARINDDVLDRWEQEIYWTCYYIANEEMHDDVYILALARIAFRDGRKEKNLKQVMKESGLWQ